MVAKAFQGFSGWLPSMLFQNIPMTESPWSKTENPHNTSEHVKCSFDNKQRFFFVSSKRKQRMSNDKTKSAEIAGKTLPPLSRSILRGQNKKGVRVVRNGVGCGGGEI